MAKTGNPLQSSKAQGKTLRIGLSTLAAAALSCCNLIYQPDCDYRCIADFEAESSFDTVDQD